MKERNISLDIYRIICMFLITTIHITGYSDLIAHISPSHINFCAVSLIELLQIFSISGFTLISAYFLAERPGTVRKTVKFILQLSFFSITIFLLSLILIEGTLTLPNVLKSFFPLLLNHYWYPVNYVALLLLVPFLNRALTAFGQRELLKALVVVTLIVSGFFHLDPFFDPTIFVGHHTHNLIHFILLYCIAAYIRLYGVKRPGLYGVGMFLVSGCLLFVLTLLDNNGFGGLAEKYPLIRSALARIDLLSYNSILSMAFTVSSFIVFVYMKVPAGKHLSRFMSFTVPATFGIYLLQEHFTVRPLLWEIVNITKWANSIWLIPVIFLVFVCLWCAAIPLHYLYRLADRTFLHRIEASIYGLICRFEARFAGEKGQ